MRGRNTTVVSARVPDALYYHIKDLADKSGLSLSDWIKQRLIEDSEFLTINMDKPIDTTKGYVQL